MKYHTIKFLEGDKKDKVCVITAETYNQLMRDENSDAFKWYGEITLKNTCDEFILEAWNEHEKRFITKVLNEGF